jgi:caffeoyl-CoA O-methyltransferase
MNSKINQVLSKLKKQSELEEVGKVKVSHDEKMLAITPDTGKFFNILLKTANTKNMLEIGTSTGFSTLWFADALITNHNRNCNIITIEENSSKIKRAKDNFEKAGVSNIITIKKGKAEDVLKELSKEFSKNSKKIDFVFIDADKENMIQYFDQVLPLVKKGGIIAADNILYPEKFRPMTEKYSKHVQKQTSVQTVTVPIGNGEEISFKISDNN